MVRSRPFRWQPLVVYRGILLLLILGGAPAADAQQLVAYAFHLTEEFGLPDPEIYDIAEDQDGIIWLATNSGLYAYDGCAFRLHRHPTQKGQSVFNLLIGQRGEVYCNNISGQIFRYQNGRMNLLGSSRPPDAVGLDDLALIDGELIVRGMLALAKFNAHSEHQLDTITHFIPRSPSSKLVPYEGGHLIYQNNALCTYAQGKCEVLHTYPTLGHYVEAAFLLNFDGILVISFYRGSELDFYLLDGPEARPINDFAAIESHSLVGYRKLRGIHWLLTSGGAFGYRIEGQKVVLVKTLLANKTTTDAICDREGNLWISTLKHGLYVFPPEEVQLLELPYLPDQNIREVLTPTEHDVYFIANNTTLYHVNTQQKTSRSYLLSPFSHQHIYTDSLLPYLDLYNGPNISRIVLKNWQPQSIRTQVGPKFKLRLTDKLFFSSHYWGVHIHDEANEVDRRIYKRAYTASATPECAVYINFEEGLMLTDTLLEKQAFVQFCAEILRPRHLLSEINSERTWLMTDSLLLGMEKGVVTTQLGTAQGLFSTAVTAIAIDEQFLYLAHPNNIQALRLRDQAFFDFPYLPMLRQTKVRELRVQGDWLWINTGRQLYRLPKRSLHLSARSPIPLRIKTVTVDDAPQLNPYQPKLSEQAQRLDIYPSLPGVLSNERYRYEYRWNKESDWRSYPANTGQLQFENIPAGQQTLAIRARERYGSRISATQRFTILRAFPYWQRWWFYGLLVAGTLAISYLLFERRRRKRRQQFQQQLQTVEQEKQIIQLQLENLRSQMNPHFVFNALNSIQDYIVNNEQRLAAKFLVKFSRLIRLYLDHSRTASISLAEEIDALELYLTLEKDRFENTLNYCIQLTPDLPTDQLSVPSLLLQPYVENAINHGLLHQTGKRNLFIQFAVRANYLHCTIEDNGIGRIRAQQIADRQHQSFSTDASIDRIALLNRDLEQKLSVQTEDLYRAEGQPAGTRVTIQIPLNYEDYHY
ncbi:MAG: histidine kinase [Bacteroidota bacterium]